MIPRKPLEKTKQPIELPERWRHFEDVRGLHIEACDETGATKAVLRVREAGISGQRFVIKAEYVKGAETGYARKAANLLMLAAERLDAETGRPRAIVEIGGKPAAMEKGAAPLNAEHEAGMHELARQLQFFEPLARRLSADSDRTVEEMPDYKWVVKFKKPPEKIIE